MTKTKAKKSSGSIRVRPTLKETEALKRRVSDLLGQIADLKRQPTAVYGVKLMAERDALAVRVLELESAGPPSLVQARVAALEAFLREAVRSSIFNFSEAGKLLDPQATPAEPIPG